MPKEVVDAKEVQGAIGAIVDYPVELEEIPKKILAQEPNKKAATPNNQARNEMILSFYLMWLSVDTIQKTINAKAIESGWEPILDVDNMYRLISKESKKRVPEWNLKEHLEWLRQAAYARQEILIEKAAVFVSKMDSNKMKPFEYMTNIEKLFQMMQQAVENRNWNESRMNPLVAINNNFTQLNTFEDNKQQAIVLGMSDPALTALKNKLESKFGVKD